MTSGAAGERLHLVRAEDQKRMAWKNGGGMTTEIAVHPAGAPLDDFEWRVSTAYVGTDGPFSDFPGIDRTIAVLEGAGLVLKVDGDEPIRLSQETAPFAFAADRQTQARLIEGPITDLNVMSRRATWRHTLERIAIAGSYSLASSGTPWLVYCQTGSVKLTTTKSLDMSPGDAVVGYADRAEIASRSQSVVFVIAFHHA